MQWKRLTKPRFLFVYPLVIALFLSAHISEKSLRVGILLIVLGQAVRFWANGYVGHLKVNKARRGPEPGRTGRLMTAGPYARVRHPLYFGTLLIGAGFCLMVHSLWLTLAALAAFLFTYRRKMSQEEALLRQEYGEAYERYHRAVPQLLPIWRRYPGGEGRWSWAGIAASKEWKTALWVLILVILVYFWEESIQEREWLFEERTSYRAFLLGLVVAAALADAAMELAARRKRMAAPLS